jgi:hypothetical protein
MTTTVDTFPAFVTLPHHIPARVVRALTHADVQGIAWRFADLHRAHVAHVRTADRAVTLYPFATHEQAHAFAESMRDDHTTVTTVAPDVPEVGALATVHGVTGHGGAVVTAVRDNGISVRIGDGRAQPFKRAGRRLYRRGDTVVTLV